MTSSNRVPASVRRAVNIADLRRLAKRRLPALVFDYIDGGADEEVTLRENSRAFHLIQFRPRQCVAVPTSDLRTTVLGTTFDLPFLLAPIGFSRMLYPLGEAHAARAANAAGTGYILSTLSGTPMEDVRSHASGPLWYQLYVPGGRTVAEASIARAKAAGYLALVVTIDTPVSGMRERDHRNGMRPLLTKDWRGSLPHLWQFATHPRWVMGYLGDGAPLTFPNVQLPGVGAMPSKDVGAMLENTVITWDDFGWIREAWNGPIVVKGVHTGDDARRAVDAGAQAVIVSNHGGRQLDGVPPSLTALPEVLAAVGDRAEVLVDGGIRRGGDVVKALCLGARAVLVGRAYAWALAAAGGPGVDRAIEILRADIVRTLRLLGCSSTAKLDASYLEQPGK
ncbi:MAG TPA: alpha-hydroxy acid oxidase [Vicinamibacterales bacterium]|jgi:L-lactate dehydrogenase (cytochrome)